MAMEIDHQGRNQLCRQSAITIPTLQSSNLPPYRQGFQETFTTQMEMSADEEPTWQ